MPETIPTDAQSGPAQSSPVQSDGSEALDPTSDRPRSWEPANEAERRMLAALNRDATAEYFQLVATSPLYLPAHSGRDYSDGGDSDSGRSGQEHSGGDGTGTGTPTGAESGGSAPAGGTAAGAGPRPGLCLWQVDEVRYLVAFTSPENLVVTMGTAADTYIPVDYPALLNRWPDPAWRLALNPGTPIDAFVPVAAVGQAARGELHVPTARPHVADYLRTTRATADEAAARALDDARAAGDPAQVLDALVACRLLLPTAATPGSAVPPLGRPDFPWLVERPWSGEPARIVVYTSVERLARSKPTGTAVVEVDVVDLATNWPNQELDLVVDPDPDPDPGSGLVVEGVDVGRLPAWSADLAERRGLVKPSDTIG